MRILALESSGLVASVAIIEDDNLLAEYSTNVEMKHSETLLPMLEEIVKVTKLDLNSIEAIALSNGPGSFTGLRIGSATAKGMGFALGKPIIPVPTLEGLVYNCYGGSGIMCPIMDARRSEVYTALYQFVIKKGTKKDICCKLRVLLEPQAIGIMDLIAEIDKLGKHVTFIGDGIPVYKDIIKEKLKSPASFAKANQNRQRAASIAVRGLELYHEGKYIDSDDEKPEYFRKTQPEREAEEKEKAENIEKK
ncbi:MAG: tRNA (adenosine(37)-N6)-threonylcarbamoyltransferase complex dimerization subunit type 1 TsaB [Lachnospiraceae bacterium]|jgi:tRNA threonylcarbamoyladenosine biosynthesis protein TsaB|nr:tRNA (adenosine(37)-N6)-threonylcarbamoyltransferase complex dimerization subunit type 1 TsaB [Lachnospiraceae bacterium]